MKSNSSVFRDKPTPLRSYQLDDQNEDRSDSEATMKGDQQGSVLPTEIISEDESIEEIVRETPLPGASQHLRSPEQYISDSHELPDPEPRKAAYTGRIQTEYDIPEWFPKRIKRMFLVDRHGGQFTFTELDAITRYRAAMERTKRRKWATYTEAGRARWQLQKVLRRIRSKPFTKTFLDYRKFQYETWKKKALDSWKRLEKLHLGIRVLDEAIDINFQQERIIYEKSLGGRLRR